MRCVHHFGWCQALFWLWSMLLVIESGLSKSTVYVKGRKNNYYNLWKIVGLNLRRYNFDVLWPSWPPSRPAQSTAKAGIE